MSFSPLDHLKAPFRQLPMTDRERILSYIMEGNNHQDLALLYLDSLGLQDLVDTYNESKERDPTTNVDQ